MANARPVASEQTQPSQQFQMVRKGAAVVRDEARPPAELLTQTDAATGALVCPPGTIVKHPTTGVQWIAMPAVAARWERSKRPVLKPAPVQSS